MIQIQKCVAEGGALGGGNLFGYYLLIVDLRNAEYGLDMLSFIVCVVVCLTKRTGQLMKKVCKILHSKVRTKSLR